MSNTQNKLNQTAKTKTDYTLYYSQGACSVATQVVLNELGQDYQLINVTSLENFTEINPVGAVPALVENDIVLTEGAAIILHLLDKHANSLLAVEGPARQQGVQDILFANATMHPAYGRLFFINQYIQDDNAKQDALNNAATLINKLWQVVEAKLEKGSGDFLGGKQVSAADIMLSVYSAWGPFFPVDIIIGPKTQAMLANVQQMPNYQKVVEKEAALANQA
ncbi:glutathione S-transferase [Marinomonas sp. S3726]|uniref:glutathione S-transferase family protein n=1 Tax=Marinomonas sp. S3726 TaxID=579484 RepID=UPI0005FA23E7|nr:glutathione S-transferase family protein [Marinomonas sp. S3726]KJZ12532.1 glutathione S-transferase [Marinomonas sp. S3726]